MRTLSASDSDLSNSETEYDEVDDEEFSPASSGSEGEINESSLDDIECMPLSQKESDELELAVIALKSLKYQAHSPLP